MQLKCNRWPCNLIFTLPVQNQQRDVVELLLAKTSAAKTEGRLPSKSGWGVLHTAVALNDRALTALLLEAGLSINERMSHGETSLQIALVNQSADMVQFLFKNKAAPNMDDGHGTYPITLSFTSS